MVFAIPSVVFLIGFLLCLTVLVDVYLMVFNDLTSESLPFSVSVLPAIFNAISKSSILL